MTVIKLEMLIDAPVETCFDLSLSIDFHKESMKDSNEKAVAGVTSGLIREGQSVTWRAVHFFIPFHMTVEITKVDKPFSFHDKMINGPFSNMVHHHYFKDVNGKTLMTDEFLYTAPLGPIGKFVDWLILRRYMTQLLQQRNDHLKKFAESGEARRFVSAPSKL